MERFEDPSVDDIGRLRARLGEHEQLTTPEDCCVVECRSACCPIPPYDCCLWGDRC